MGVNESLMMEETKIPEEFRPIKTYHDRRFGNVTLLNSKNNKSHYFIQKTVIIASEEEAIKAIDTLKIRSNAGSFYAKYVLFETQSMNKLCLEAVQLVLIVEYSKNNLKSEIRTRRTMNTEFEIEEVFQIFDSGLRFCEYLTNQKEREYLLAPESVLLHPKGNITYIESKFLKPETDIYKKMFAMCSDSLKEHQFSLMAPEELSALRERVPQPQIDNEKAQIFCLGIVIFCAIGLCSVSKFFDLDELQFRHDIVEKLVFNSQLPIEFLEIILKCVKEDPHQRPNGKELLKELGLLKIRLQINSNLEEAVFEKKSQRFF